MRVHPRIWALMATRMNAPQTVFALGLWFSWRPKINRSIMLVGSARSSLWDVAGGLA
jgi:hypothetical protein